MKNLLITLILVATLALNSFASSKSIVEIATGDENFSVLVEALTRSDLDVDFVGVLSESGPYTVFAPTNDAFSHLLKELGAESLSDIDSETLESVLKMHVVPSKVLSGDLSEGLKAESLVGEHLHFSLKDGAKVKDPNGRMINITGVDVEAKNGVVHVVDKVILPELPKKSKKGGC